MDIYELQPGTEGWDTLTYEINWARTNNRTIRIGVDDGVLKLKTGEGAWSLPLVDRS